LSKTWYIRNEDDLKKLKKNTENFFRTASGSEAEKNMYTCFKNFEKK